MDLSLEELNNDYIVVHSRKVKRVTSVDLYTAVRPELDNSDFVAGSSANI